MQITSSAFREGLTIPTQYTADGDDLSPPLQWSGIPAGAKSLALICDDPDAPRGTWVHWVLFNLPADTCDLPQDAPESLGWQGKNDFGKLGYGGPSPPPGKSHRYFFRLYALDAVLKLPEGSTKSQLEKAMKGHVLAEAQIMGNYQRSR